ncbi:MgtC/SapB family protein [Phenylobacterium sp.]|uniref:MgtC/SapB family protein n=1 Tax=Phenylobacterium sp. TaxID=1871053 RepID=UPI0035B3D6BD
MVTNLELIVRLGLAALIGSAVGIERERLRWAAGLRTHMLVCVGSCLVMIVSAYGFSEVLGPHVVLDPSRVAAQVVSGIGFLGAGSIILRNEVVKGLTTAASVWTVAALGLAVGGGLYVPAAAAAVIVLLILAVLKPMEDRFWKRRSACQIELSAPRGAVSVGFLEEVLSRRASQITQLIVRPSADDPSRDDVRIAMARMPLRALEDVLSALRNAPEVRDVRAIR